MIWLILVLILAYFVAAGVCEGAAQKDITITQSAYHKWRLLQTASVMILSGWAAGVHWPAALCLVVAGDALYNRVCWYVARHDWVFNSYNGTWWSLPHWSPVADWVRTGAGIVGAVCLSVHF